MQKLLFLYFCILTVFFTASLLKAQDLNSESTTVQEVSKIDLQNNSRELTLKIRDLVEKKQYKEVYSSIYNALENKQIEGTWFFYIMLSEAAYMSYNLKNLVTYLPDSGTFKILRKSLELINQNDIIVAAKLLAHIAKEDPSISYFIGKLYLSQGHLYEGVGYLLLGANMREAPYGLYYAGLGQNAVGEYSNAQNLFSKAERMLLLEELSLKRDITAQKALSEFYDGNYKKAYEYIMSVYQENPIETLNVLDPGIVLTMLKQHQEAKDFWNSALRLKLPNILVQDIKKKLDYNKYLVNKDYPPLWMRR